jgi:hypothetical protein
VTLKMTAHGKMKTRLAVGDVDGVFIATFPFEIRWSQNGILLAETANSGSIFRD